MHCKYCFSEMIFTGSDVYCEHCLTRDLLTMKVPKVEQIGFELEGNWEYLPDRNDVNYSEHDDSSVNNMFEEEYCGDCEACDNDRGYCDNNSGYCGELVSSPFLYSDSDAWKYWIQKCYPDHHDDSCGAHFHVELSNTNAYETLCTPEFNGYFIKNLYNWGERANIRNRDFWDRLNGNNSMCTPDFAGDAQLKVRNGDNYPSCRYTALNFHYAKHNTLEVRVLPVFQKSRIYIRAVEVCVNLINSYLKRESKKDFVVEEEQHEIPSDFQGRITSRTLTELL